MAVTFLELSNDLHLDIICLLDLRGILSCQQTCRYLNRLVNDSSLAQYLIELSTAGMVDNPHCELPFARRLELLRKREEGWANVRVAHTTNIKIEHMETPDCRHSGSVYVLGGTDIGNGDVSWPVTWSLHYLVLPGWSLESTEMRVPPWKVIQSEEAVIDFGLCLQEHGLIAVLTGREQPFTHDSISVYLLDLHTGFPHVAAMQPKISVMETPLKYNEASSSVEVVGEILALLIVFPFGPLDGEDCYFIYQWKTGRLLKSDTFPRGTYQTFVFLTEKLIVLPNARAARLEIYRISDIGVPFELVNVLGLPVPLKPIGINCQAKPNPMGKPSGRTCARTASHALGFKQKPFYADPIQGIIVFRIGVRSPSACVYSLVVHKRSVLDIIEKFSSCGTSASKVVNWEEWSPQVTQWLNTSDPSHLCAIIVAGQRYAIMHGDRSHPCPARVLDFNPYNVRRRAAGVKREESLSGQAGTFGRRSGISEKLFQKDSLPFVENVFERPYDGVTMDDERIIGLKLDNDRHHIACIDIHDIA